MVLSSLRRLSLCGTYYDFLHCLQTLPRIDFYVFERELPIDTKLLNRGWQTGSDVRTPEGRGGRRGRQQKHLRSRWMCLSRRGRRQDRYSSLILSEPPRPSESLSGPGETPTRKGVMGGIEEEEEDCQDCSRHRERL